ncbi:response regulator transcription factor [Rhodocytophaga rosea]|uniref:Response regulator transcription factor n=1 Tax=Rhodocytophaga rosea TaxID=2704465 RepID=A0A6C0GSM4_9BACT|nr:LytTR family DNA-binding domain-containing protein [Rhodocytophaga rosea]QHT70957.1 response regulator transcription factor [Rhodocytophaga rosea]
MKYRYLIVDDEPLARKLVLAHTSKIEGLELAGECEDAIVAGNMLRSKPVDLLFLDIQLPEINGLKLMGTLKNPPAVIITTAYRDFAPEAFDLDVIDYLLKPIAFERLMKAVNKFFDRKAIVSHFSTGQEEQKAFIYLKAERKSHKVYMEDILYVESLDDYVKVHLHNQMLITRENISQLEQKLPAEAFVRIHRSFIVAVKAVSCISLEGVEVKGKRLPFGRVYKHSALAGLKFK